MSLTQIPEWPLRGVDDQDVFSGKVEDVFTAMPQFISELNAIGDAYALSTNGTSASSVLIGTGAKSFTTQTGLGYKVGMTLRIANTSINYMTGDVTSYNAGTGALVMNITSVSGSGTFGSWVITMAAVGANSAVNISITPAGNIASTNVQAAIQELDTEKLSSTPGAVTGINLENVITGGSVGSISAIPAITYDENGRITAVSSVVNYPCRAWVNFNGTGTVAIRGSGNVSSITDNGTGNYTVNFTTAMPNANYSIAVGLGMSNSSAHYISAQSTSSLTINTFQWTGSSFGTATDLSMVSVAVFS